MFGSGFGQQSANNTFGFNQQQPQTASLFGQPAQPASTPQFGSTVGAANPSGASPFGSISNSSPFGAAIGSQPQQAAASQGTAAVPFNAHEERDNTKSGKIDKYETITMMPQYASSSLQELRWQDYQAGRKGPSSAPVSGFGFGQPAAGGSSMFGQPQQQQPSGFGSSTFGNNNVNTSGGVFGQSTTTPFGGSAQPAAGGAFGSSTGGGLFGRSPSTTNNTFGSGSTFGSAPQPASTGFGFGSKSNTGTSGLFGQSNANNTGSLFGNKTAGTNSSPFGQQNTGFGFGANNSAQNSTTNAFGSAGAGTSGSGLFGQPSTTGNAFGQTSSTTGGLFGNNNNTNTGSGGLFGQSNPAQTGTGLFGQQNTAQQQQQQPSTGLFGQSNTSNSGIFGQANNTGSGGLFGQNNNQSGNAFGQTSTTNAFGQPQQPQQQQTGFGFGMGQNKPAGSGLFGQQQNNTSSPFGQSNATGSSLFSKPATGGAFGSQPGAQPSQPAFGMNNNNTQGSTLGSGGLLGQQQQKPAFGFGQNTAASNGTTPFGMAQNKPTGGLFGQQSNTGGTGTLGSGGLFGNTAANNQPSGSTGLFGANKPNTVTGTTTSGFGQPAGTTSGGLFGNNNNNATNTASTGGGLFGSKPATLGTGGGLFGSTQNSNTGAGTGGLFGNGANGAQANNTSLGAPSSGGLFGANKPASTSGGGLFGSNLTNTSNAANANGGGIFGRQLPNAAGQNTTAPVAAIDNNAYLSNPLFSNVQQPSNGVLQGEQAAVVPKNKASSFKTPTGTLLAQVMQPRSLPRGRRLTSKESAQTDADSTPKRDRTHSVISITISDRDIKDEEGPEKFRNVLFSNTTDDIILNTEAFNFARNGLQQIGITKESSPQAVSVSTPTRLNKKTQLDSVSTASPSISQIDDAGNESYISNGNAANGSLQNNESGDHTSIQGIPAEADTPDNELVDAQGYWISPAQHKLANMTLRELRSVKYFRVGQRTQGFVEFLEPVDLSLFSNVQTQVCSHIVVFGDRSFCLYPIESERPPVGQGFNVKHRVTLYNIFARYRDTREPVKDPEHPVAKKFMKRLQSLGKFVSWSAKTGAWTFEVDPASK